MTQAPSSVTSPIPTELLAEWDIAYEEARARILDGARDHGALPATVEYISAMRFYIRSPFPLTLWVPDPTVRMELTCDLAMHIVGMKLLDDLIDGDNDVDRYDLGGCLLLQHRAVRGLTARAQEPRHILEVLDDEFVTIGVGTHRSRSEPAQNLAQWRDRAEAYGSAFLGCYGTLAAIAGGVPEAIGPANLLGRRLGMIVTIADDLTDYYRNGQRTGNLGHLIKTDQVTTTEVAELVEEMRSSAAGLLRESPPVYDVTPVVDLYADDVVTRILAGYAAQADSR